MFITFFLFNNLRTSFYLFLQYLSNLTPVISNIYHKFLSWALCNLFHLVKIVEFTFYGQGSERILFLRLIWSITHNACHIFKYQQEHSASVGRIAELTSIQIKLKNIWCDYCGYFNKFWKFSCGLTSSLVFFQKTCMSFIYALLNRNIGQKSL